MSVMREATPIRLSRRKAIVNSILIWIFLILEGTWNSILFILLLSSGCLKDMRMCQWIQRDLLKQYVKLLVYGCEGTQTDTTD